MSAPALPTPQNNFMEALPPDVRRYMFSFADCHSLNTLAGTCKLFGERELAPFFTGAELLPSCEAARCEECAARAWPDLSACVACDATACDAACALTQAQRRYGPCAACRVQTCDLEGCSMQVCHMHEKVVAFVFHEKVFCSEECITRMLVSVYGISKSLG
jgi:hypothetical protein